MLCLLRRIPPPALTLALALPAAACGSGAAWSPAPVSVIPISTVTPVQSPPLLDSERPAPPAPGKPEPKAPAGPSPVSGELPGDLAAPLAASATCKEKECAVPGLYPPAPASPGVDPKAPAAVWSHDLVAAGSTVTLPKHAGVDLYGVVLDGSITVKGAAADEKPLPAKRWWAFHAAGAGVSIAAVEPRARVALAVVSGGEPIADAVVKLRGKDGGKLEWKKRPSPIELVDLSAARDLSWAGGAVHARIGFEGDKRRASLGVLIASKDAPVAQHQHDGSWEILIALSAAGTALRAPAAGSTQLAPAEVGDGAVITIPKSVVHAWVPGGTKPLVALQLYVPGGPEQRFKNLAGDPQGERSKK